MAKSIANLPASVHQLLLNKAKESSRPFNEILQYFAIERCIYRLSKSPHADQFILKGALMFAVWCAESFRCLVVAITVGAVVLKAVVRLRTVGWMPISRQFS